MRYAKIIDNGKDIEFAPKTVKVNGKTVINPNARLLAEAGYYPVSEDPAPAAQEGKIVIISKYVLTPNGVINILWAQVDDPALEDSDSSEATGPISYEGMKIVVVSPEKDGTTSTAMLSPNAYNNVYQDDETVLKVQFPESYSNDGRKFLLVYHCSVEGQTELALDIDTNLMTVLMPEGDGSILVPKEGLNIYQFEEVSANTFMLTKPALVEI